MKIIGVSGVSGAGKTTLVCQLEKTLQATAVFWDDYDGISQSPADYVEWYYTSRNFNDWKYDELAHVLKELKKGKEVICPATKKRLYPTEYVLFDAPLGYLHEATGCSIDFLICLDTPLDISLARRLLKDPDYDLKHYLSESRPLYILPSEHRDSSDLVLDGSLPLEELECHILQALKNCQKFH